MATHTEGWDEFPQMKNCAISRFRWLLFYIAEEFQNDDTQKAKFLLKDKIKPHFDSVKNAHDLFDALEKIGMVRPGDVSTLRVLLQRIPCEQLLQKIDQYEAERPVVLKDKSTSSQRLSDAFIGRKNELQVIKYLLENSGSVGHQGETVKGVFICGFPGIGKTSLAREVVMTLSHGDDQVQTKELVEVDLRGLNTIQSVFFRVMEALGKPVKEFKDLNSIKGVLWESLIDLTEQVEDYVLLLDNADKMTEPGTKDEPNDNRKPFLDFLRILLSVDSPKIKFIVTSRYNLQVGDLPLKLFNMDKMTVEDSMSLIKHYSSTKLEDPDAKALAQQCGFHPQAMKIVAPRLRDGMLNVQQIIHELSDQVVSTLNVIELAGSENKDSIESCFESTFQELAPSLQNVLIMLSVIPGTFTLNAAAAILLLEETSDKHGSQEPDLNAHNLDAQMHLTYLCERNLLEYSTEKRNRRYQMHLLMRAYLTLKSDSESYKFNFHIANNNFQRYYSQRLVKVARLLQREHKRAMKEKDLDYPNFLQLLREYPELPEHVGVEKFHSVSYLLDLILDEEEKRIYFQRSSDDLQSQNHLLECAEMKCHLADQKRNLGHPISEIETILREAEEMLRRVPEQESRSVQFVLAYYKLVRGLVLVYENPKKKNRKDFRKGKKHIYDSFIIRRKLHGEHTFSLRSLNELGYAYFQESKIWQFFWKDHIANALKCFQKCVEIQRQLNGQHVDMSMYLQSLGSCHECNFDYKEALKCYQEANNLNETLGLSSYISSVFIFWNIATTKLKLKQYQEALDFAEQSLERRRKIFGVHPNTAACLCLIGIIQIKRENYEDAECRLEDAFRMEYKLVSNGRPPSEQWERLQKAFKDLLTATGRKEEFRSWKCKFEEADRIYQAKLDSRQFPSSSNGDDEDQEDSDDENTGTMWGPFSLWKTRHGRHGHDDPSDQAIELNNLFPEDDQPLIRSQTHWISSITSWCVLQ